MRMIKLAAVIACLLVLLNPSPVMALPREQSVDAGGPVVRVLLLWMDSCGHCHEIIERFLPRLQEQYGDQLEITLLELVTMEDVDMLYQLAGDAGVDSARVSVPFLLVGEHALIGSAEIQQKLPGLVERYLSSGGVGFPSLQGRAADLLSMQTPDADECRLEQPCEEVNSHDGTKDNSSRGASLNIYFFWGDGCPHCAEQKPFMEDLAQRYPEVRIRSYEVWYVDENRQILFDMAASAGFEAQSVPTTFIGDKVWTGFRSQLKGEMEAAVRACLENGCPDPGRGVAGTGVSAGEEPSLLGIEVDEPNLLVLPLIGAVNLDVQSLAFSTAMIAFVDGFNPCSLWVLSILLALVLHSGSRRRILAVGLTFLIVTGSVYGLFIAGLFKVFTVVSFIGWLQSVVALLALGFALVNIKDYFWYKEGLSFTISDKHKPKIYRNFRSLLSDGKSSIALVGATTVMALGIALVELPCTAGFPVLWSKLVASQQISSGSFVMLLGLYLVVYLLDELLVFFSAVVTLRASKIEEKHGRLLKLVGGMVMLSLALVLLLRPDLMNSLASSVLVFGGALAATLVILLIHRGVLPRFGIFIGTEAREAGIRSGKSRAAGG